MAQKQDGIKPFFLNMDTDYSELKPKESPYLKSVVWDINGNPATGAGTNNPTGEGQNLLAITKTRTNVRVANVNLPINGYNKHMGAFESVTTNELFHVNYNSAGEHAIYVLSGDTGLWQQVIIDPELLFSDDAEAFMANHRMSLRFTRDRSGNIIEKYLLITDGQSWHKYISVIAAIKTNGFDATLNPYWTLQPPHFDRRELLEWAVRPPMVKPIVSTIPNSLSDKGKINQIIDKAFQVALCFQNTDGRPTTLSPYSLPLIVKSSDYLNNATDVPKKAKFILPAGSPLTERVLLYIRRAEYDKNTFSNGSIIEWGDWFLYDTLDKFTSTGVNSPSVIGNDYWLRKNQWTGYNYDSTFNTIEYIFDNSRVPDVVNQDDANMMQTGMPQLSVAMTDLGDAILLGDNRYGYPNFTDEVIDNLDVEVKEKAQLGCVKPLRDMYFYAYVGRCGMETNFTSQVGFYLGADKKIRFGGMNAKSSSDVTFNVEESDIFELNFADKNSFQVYLKGTTYSAVGEWYRVNPDNSIVKLDAIYDWNDTAQRNAAAQVIKNGGYFVARFKITAPADRYIVSMGRHNVPIAGDYRATSTYVYGIANSRQRTNANGCSYIRPNAIVTASKEMEVDCTAGDVDTWGNNADLFYIYCPYVAKGGNDKFRFIEGYLKESVTNPLGMEQFLYQMNHAATDDCGNETDKNGFYWAYTKVANSDKVDIQFKSRVNCIAGTFEIPTSGGGLGWMQNAIAYFTSFNNNAVGDCNRIIYKGKITDLTGTINYSNVSISIKDGDSVKTRSDGTFTLIIHNGKFTPRSSNIYVNAGGNFIITIASCGQVPLFHFDENLVPCISCSVRTYPIQLLLGVKIDSPDETSLKEGAKYSIGVYGADLAGRVMFLNEIKNISVPSFLERNNLNATYFRMLIKGALTLNNYPDIKWIFPAVSKNLSQRRYLDWVGDNIKYIDNGGQVVSDPSNAVFCSITITSLFNYNVSNNFNVLSNYQFVPGDRLRILDDGKGKLFDIATFGDEIDLEIFGTNFNQAAINAGLIPPATNTVLDNAQQSAQAKAITLIVRYDTRLDKLINNVGFWIETYTPTKERDVIPFLEIGGAYPVINGEIAEYTGGGIANPQYNYPSFIDIDFWDTYFLNRNITIPNVGSQFFSHIFQSPNITDQWGKEVTSGGRKNVVNKNAKQMWFGGDLIKSDDFVKEGLVNGLAWFDPKNRRTISTYPFGDIVAMKSERNIIAVICENDYCMMDYNYHYVYPNEQGVMVTNISEGLSTPHQKVKGKYGILKQDTGTFLSTEDGLFWLDNKNSGFIKMDFRTAFDISQLSEEVGEAGGIQSYLNSKLQFINEWNRTHTKDRRFDCIAGIDQERGDLFLTFKNRRSNNNDMPSYINTRRDVDLKASETIVYSMQYHAWLRFEGFVPEGYGRLRGKKSNVEMYTFAASVPYAHNNTPNNSYLKFYEIQTEPVIKGVFNGDKALVQLFQSMAHDSNPHGWFIDTMYTNFPNSFSYLSANHFKKKEGMWYSDIKRNMNSYPSNDPQDLFRSMLFDGYRMFGRYLVFRMVGSFSTLEQYTELNNIYILKAPSGNNKK